MVDRLAHAKARPRLVEDAVRTALRDAVAWRIGGGSAPDPHAFATAAVACGRQTLDASAADAAERSRTLGAIQLAAKRFAISALGRRLMSLPATQFVRLPSPACGPDAIVRDRRHRLHLVSLKLQPDTLDAGRAATEIANVTPLAAQDRLNPLTVHVFSLATGARRTFQRDVCRALIQARVA